MKTVNEIIESFFDESSLAKDKKPEFVLFTGGVGSGKTTMRKQHYPSGYVVVDGCEIFRLIGEGNVTGDIEPFLPAIDQIGNRVTARAIAERRNMVMEIVGDDLDETKSILEAMRKHDYETKFIFVDCDPKEAYLRHTKAVQEDKLYLSCYFTKDLHRKWIMDGELEGHN